MSEARTPDADDRTVIRLTRRRAAGHPPDDDLATLERVQGQKLGSTHYRWRRTRAPFHRVSPGTYAVGSEHLAPRGFAGRAGTAVRHALIGVPLSTDRLAHERLSKVKALAVFSSDAISSSAYATEEILRALLIAGAVATTAALPISMSIAALLAVVVFSYRQTVRAYPGGGGSYIVAKDNLGTVPGLTAGAALMIDYVLTVAVSIAAGTAAIISAAPALEAWRIEMSVAFVALMTLANLRGVRESGNIFAVPAYLFILSFGGMIIFGLLRLALGEFDGASILSNRPPAGTVAATGTLGIFLVLKAFASGSTALTGVEAISNGVPAFKPSEPRNASTTLVWMAVILGFFFVGVTLLSTRLGILPGEDETVVSLVAREVLGSSVFYYAVQATTAMILVLAANTSFADFPRLASILSRDHYLPHQLSFRGERLAFTNGIVLLGLFSAVLLIIFGGDTHRLIPLYAVGVFLSFTLSQSGMVRHWLKTNEPGRRRSMFINGAGAIATAVVAVVVIGTKFTHGAWLVVVVIPILVVLFRRTFGHYAEVSRELAVRGDGDDHPPATPPGKVIVPVGNLNRAVVETVRYAESLPGDVRAVHIVDTEVDNPDRLRAQWVEWFPGTPLITIDSGIRAFTEPLLVFLDETQARMPRGAPLTVVIAEFIPRHWWQRYLHNQTSRKLVELLRRRPNTVVILVPQHLGAKRTGWPEPQ